MFFYKKQAFIELLDDFRSTWINFFNISFSLPKTTEDYFIDIQLLTNKIKEKISSETIEKLLKQKVLPSMPNYVWDINDFDIFNENIINFIEENKLESVFSDPLIRRPRNKSQAIKFLKQTFELFYYDLLQKTSEQTALIKAERINEKNLSYLKISREILCTLQFIKDFAEEQLEEIRKKGFNMKKVKSFLDHSKIITLLSLRMYSISTKINKLDLALKETNYLAMERIKISMMG